jgi:hypothetical protein
LDWFSAAENWQNGQLGPFRGTLEPLQEITETNRPVHGVKTSQTSVTEHAGKRGMATAMKCSEREFESPTLSWSRTRFKYSMNFVEVVLK